MGKLLEALTVVQPFELLAKRAGSLSRCSHSRPAFAALQLVTRCSHRRLVTDSCCQLLGTQRCAAAVCMQSAAHLARWRPSAPPTCKPTAICICKMWCT